MLALPDSFAVQRAPTTLMNIADFITRWLPSAGSERANKDSFLKEFCQVLGLPEPNPKCGDREKDGYVFERDVLIQAPDGKATTHFIDLYRENCFVLEAKQSTLKKTVQRPGRVPTVLTWENDMEKARTQAVRYALNVKPSPPVVIVCDIARCFDIYTCFDGSARYQAFPIPEKKRIPFVDLAAHADLFRTIWQDPYSLDPSRKAREVSEEVAASLANLAADLEKSGHAPEFVAEFLMRCVFTMFAEDVGLLEEKHFTTLLKTRWIPKPHQFAAAIEHLWQAMDRGTFFGADKLLRFNGGLFERCSGMSLTAGQLEKLLIAAEHDWSKVEPAIFGTLLEKALGAKERHKLGAHYTPREYVERLVRPTVDEPIRDEWDVVRAETYRYRELGKAGDAREVLRQFHARLTQIKVLDPACGTGNFLYVTLDLLKQIESEVLTELRELGETQQLLDIHRVSPAQLYGIELNPRAKAIAELVLWIGHLQWHYKVHGRLRPPPEPVLQNLHSIEWRDAILAWDRVDIVRDEQGKPVTRWDGETKKQSPVTGEMVPDETARIAAQRYVNPRKADWPKADFVVGNPPFLGNWRMREALGDGYVEALRAVYGDVPESCDYVMYWWNLAAHLLREGALRRFGLITTNSITQVFAGRLLQGHLDADPGISLAFAIADHPWVDCEKGAAVRIAMTVARAGKHPGRLARVTKETSTGQRAVDVDLEFAKGIIHSNLRVGVKLTDVVPLRANERIASRGVSLHGAGFLVTTEQAEHLGLGKDAKLSHRIKAYRNGRDLTGISRNLMVIDMFGLEAVEVRKRFPAVYQWLLDRVKPERDQNNRATYRINWWIFGEPRALFRPALHGLSRYISTPETSKHRWFVFLDHSILPDNKLVNIATDDAYCLGILSSRIHVVWALAVGGHLGVGNDPVYIKTKCFDAFPFPQSQLTKKRQSRIRALAEELDAHRKQQLALHPELTMTAMYNSLEQLRAGEPLQEKDRAIHEQALTSVLKQLHDDLDAAVFDAYGWPRDLTDEQILENLVALNAERAEEERHGTVRWVRPEFQNPATKPQTSNLTLAGMDEDNDTKEKSPAAEIKPWPKRPGQRMTALRDLIVGSKRLWRLDEVTSSFKGAKKKDIEDLLDSLVAIGVLVAYGESDKELRWAGG